MKNKKTQGIKEMFSEKLKQWCKVIQVALIAVALMLGLAVPTQPAHAADNNCSLIQSMDCYANLFPGDKLTIESHTGISATLYVVNPNSREKQAVVEFNYGDNLSEIKLLPYGSVTFDIPRKEKPFIPTNGSVENKTEDVILRLSLVRNV
ncbi:MAG: hypothetical protein EBE86_015105 [Hormoscilla sp. GUM202]|nr:hypothetical protein [Hormoscilla sp. GUM202]